MSVNKLSTVLIPPEKPFRTKGGQSWEEIEESVGTALPSDYKEFISTYGTGGIDDFLWILTPFVKDENVNLITKSRVILEAYVQSKQNHPEYYPHGVFPNENGLLPWAFTDNGDVLYWLVKGNPDQWKIVAYDSRSENYEYPLSMTEFLYGIINKSLVCEVFPEDFPNESPEFISYDVE